MGWFRSGKDEGILGDGPADRITKMLKQLNRERGAKPTLEDLLYAVYHALALRLADIASDSEPPVRAVKAFMTTGGVTACGPENPSDEESTKVVFQALEDIAVEYEETELARKPSVSEILGNICFVLAPDTEQYVTTEGRGNVDRLVAVR
jgi:hypothetical protein